MLNGDISASEENFTVNCFYLMILKKFWLGINSAKQTQLCGL